MLKFLGCFKFGRKYLVNCSTLALKRKTISKVEHTKEKKWEESLLFLWTLRERTIRVYENLLQQSFYEEPLALLRQQGSGLTYFCRKR